MKSRSSFLLMSLSLLGLVAVNAPQAEARARVVGPIAAVVLSAPRIVAPRVVFTPPLPPVRVMVPPLPRLTYRQVYRPEYGAPRQVYVNAYYDAYHRYVPGYSTWTY